MGNRFLSLYKTGKSDTGSMLGSFAITWGIFFLLGGLPILFIVLYYVSQGQLTIDDFLDNPNNLQAFNVPALLIFLGAMGQFPIGITALWFGNKFILKRSFKSMITSATRFRWWRLIIGLGAWMAFMAVYAGIIWLKQPETIQYRPDWNAFFSFLPFALLLVPIQCAFEEIAVRGQMIQHYAGLYKERFAPVVPLLVTSLFFAMLHSFNPEIESYGYYTMMAQYFTIGLIFGTFALLDGGLEISIGLHIGNNLFSFLFLSYPGSVLSTPSIFQQTEVNAWQDLLALIGMGIGLFVLLYGGRPDRIKELFTRASSPEN